MAKAKDKHPKDETVEAAEVKDPAEEAQPEEDVIEQPSAELAQLIRLQADFENYKKRVEREKTELVKYANERLILKLLDAVDNFQRALDSEKAHDAFYDGMRMIYDQLNKALTDSGLEEIPTDGEPFDPCCHNAVFTEEREDVEAERVIETFQKGYRLNGRVIRPAMVKVAK